MSETVLQPPLLKLTAQIVAAHAAHNHVTFDAPLRLIESGEKGGAVLGDHYIVARGKAHLACRIIDMPRELLA
jgi:hypothetical protein